jgi:universal stress protein E
MHAKRTPDQAPQEDTQDVYMNRSNLFVIIDPTREQQPALVRAADIARQMGGHLHVFCSDYVDSARLTQFKSRSDAKKRTLKQAKDLVESLIAPLRAEGLAVSTEVIWNQGWYQAAVHAAAREASDLIIKSSYSRTGRSHPLSERSDFFLIRNSTCPVLLTKSGISHTLGKVLAAVAIEKGNKDHSALNNRIVWQAKRIARAAGAELHLVAALQEQLNLEKLLDLHIDKSKGLRTEQDLIAERFGVEPALVHVRHGTAAKVIVAAAKELGVQALIIGTKARKGLKGALLGNTAEHILDQLNIDVLVIN